MLKMTGLWSINEPTATSLPPCVPVCLHATSPAQQDRSDYLTVRYSVFSGSLKISQKNVMCVSLSCCFVLCGLLRRSEEKCWFGLFDCGNGVAMRLIMMVK